MSKLLWTFAIFIVAAGVACILLLTASLLKSNTGQVATGVRAQECEVELEAGFRRASALRERELGAAKEECDRVYGPASECRDIVNGLSEECGP